MVDGEAVVMTMVMISSESPSRQGARTELLIPGIEIAAAAERGCVKGQGCRLEGGGIGD